MESARRFERWMRFSAVLYALGGLGFALAPELSFALPEQVLLNVLGLDWTPMPKTSVYHWATLAVSMMATITICSALASRKGERDRDFAIPVMVSKGVSSVGALLALGLHGSFAVYLLVFFTDFPLMLLTWWFWSRLRNDLIAWGGYGERG